MSTAPYAPTSLRVAVGPEDHSRGPEDAPLTLVEYGDYECPFCGAAHPVVLALIEVLGDNLRFVFRNFPLTSVHPHAEHAAEAAEAAGELGRFWEMHDLLYENQDRLDDAALLAYADALGLDQRFIEDAIVTHREEPRIRRDLIGGARSGVQGTPTFFINGIRHDGPPTFEALLLALEGALAASRVR